MALYKVISAATLLTLLSRESLSQPDVCGNAPLNTKIVGGQVALEGSWPWMASLHNFGYHFCGGSLINNEWVLSAAHCFTSTSASSVTVYLGRQSQEGSNTNEVSRTVTQIISHPDYNSFTQDNDIALLKLSSTVTFTNYIQPVCLSAAGSTFHDDTDTWITGWGNIGSEVSLPPPQNLMEVEVPIVGNRQCNCDYGVGQITDNMICAGLRAGGKDSCQGDSGGPIVSKQNGLWIQAGVVSFGRGCAEPNFPGVYARVSRYQDWINSEITTNQPGFKTFTSSGIDSDLSVTCDGLPAVTTTEPTTITTTAPTVFCGSAPKNTRILGGDSVTTEGLWPWMASLQKNGSHMCGGTLVSLDHVLTSADCFSSSPAASDWTVILGDLKQNGTESFEVTLNVANITVSNFTGSNVAVLRLATQPTLSDYIQPICMDNGKTFSVGMACWAAGWRSSQGGEGETLQEFQTSVVDCGTTSSDFDICTGDFTLEQGDTGGPLMCKVDGAWFQAAVLSVGNNTTAQTRQSTKTFTKLSRYQTFLSDTVGLLSPASNNTTTAAPETTSTVDATGGAPPHSTIFLFFHLLTFSLCLYLS